MTLYLVLDQDEQIPEEKLEHWRFWYQKKHKEALNDKYAWSTSQGQYFLHVL